MSYSTKSIICLLFVAGSLLLLIFCDLRVPCSLAIAASADGRWMMLILSRRRRTAEAAAGGDRKIFMDDYFLSSYPRIAGQTVAGNSTANNAAPCFRKSDP